MGWFTFALISLWILGALLVPPATRASLSPGVNLGLALLSFLFIVPVVYYSWRLFALVRGKLLWKIRSRLILAHILIGAIPVMLVVVILYVSGLLIYYQLSYYLIRNQIGIHTAQIHAYNLSLSTGLHQAMSGAREDPTALKAVLDRDAKYLLGIYRTASVILRVKNPGTGNYRTYGVGKVRSDLKDYQVPRWIGDQFFGLVSEDAQPEIYRSPGSANGRREQLYLRSVVFGEFPSDMPYSLEISLPFDDDMLERLKASLGQDLLLADHVQNSGLNVMLQDTAILRENILSATFNLDNAQQGVGRPVWSIQLYPISWSTGTEMGPADSDVLFVELSTSKMVQNAFQPGSSETNVSRTILGALQLLVGFFLAVELLSLVGGIVLTKSITNAVYNLDRGTGFIRRGDFSHRIVVKSDDQLGALAKSFNQMTDYVQTLVKEQVQKERLERELEIAKEVQEQLFPKIAPHMNKMELSGLCLPARIVSGDYYDFLQFEDRMVGLALGDICGKGISAALLMANLQATLRSNVLAQGGYSSPLGPDRNGNVAGVVKVLNQQIYSFTSANKFASFFYAVYDDEQYTLTYCNAGHNPPLYFDAGGFRRLTTGGTVVGIFPDAEFEQDTLSLQPGAILLAYTDGIVESVNEYGEEFGEQRLIDLVQKRLDLSAEQLQKAIVEEVLEWAYEEERDDDMTMIVARFR